MLTDLEIRNFIKANVRFEGKRVSEGLYLRFRKTDKVPTWRFRYRFSGKARVMSIGSYAEISLAEAKKQAKLLAARVSLGYDVAMEKQDRKRAAIDRIEAENNSYTMARLADEFFENRILGKWKHPNIVRSRIEKDIKPNIGHLKADEVKPRHIDELLKTILKRGAPTMANDVLRWLKRIFNYGIKRQILENNPAMPFDPSDAGGKELSRNRKLSRDEIVKFFCALKTTKGLSIENEYTFKILLALGVRKSELITAKWKDIDFDAAIWKLPAENTKTGVGVTIPLADEVLYWFAELKRLSTGSIWVLPARKMQDRMIPHISDSTLNAALGKVHHGLEHFTVHDFRKTTRTLLASMGVAPHIAERCLNHKIKGVEGVYDWHDYFDERKEALGSLSSLIKNLETEALLSE